MYACFSLGLLLFSLSLIHKHHTNRMITIMTTMAATIPPTTPPTIAPVLSSSSLSLSDWPTEYINER